MVVNFRIRRISRSVCKLTRTPTHIDKKKKNYFLSTEPDVKVYGIMAIHAVSGPEKHHQKKLIIA